MHPNRDWREFFESLNSAGAEYVVVGALALAFHGYPRYTGDVDIFIRQTPDNAERVVAALAAFGFGSLGVAVAELLEAQAVIQLGHPPVRIDLLTTISGVSFDQVWNSKVPGDFDGVPVHYVGRTELLSNKEAAGRPKDLSDAAELKRRS